MTTRTAAILAGVAVLCALAYGGIYTQISAGTPGVTMRLNRFTGTTTICGFPTAGCQ